MHPRLQRPCKCTVPPTPDLPFSTCPPDVHSLPHTHPDLPTLRIQLLICSCPFSLPPADTPAPHYLASPSAYITSLTAFSFCQITMLSILCSCFAAICTRSRSPVPDFLPGICSPTFWPAACLWAARQTFPSGFVCLFGLPSCAWLWAC